MRRKPPLSTSLSVRPHAVFLVGFMGAGKTSVGQALGQRLNWRFEDLDDRIERNAGRSVATIFAESGESAFRETEHEALHEVLRELSGGAARVVALGGGAFAQPRNAALIRSAGAPTVFLDAPIQELWERCCRQADESGAERPLLKSVEQFSKLYRSRRASYLSGTLRIDTSGLEVSDIAAGIAEKLGLRSITIRTEEGEVE